MKITPRLVLIAASFLIATNVAVAEPKHMKLERHDRNGWSERHERPDRPTRAPEISVASGTSTIALLSGVLLLMGERTRTRRS